MTEFKYTEEQKAAVQDIDNDIVLGAGAGSGKTRVLVGRFINLLEKKRAEVDQIMALTFTKKAAAEMQERIRTEISKKEDRAEIFKEKKYWYEQKLNLNSSVISTFHSFAAYILRQYPVISNVDPEFTVLEENEADELLEEAIDNIIEQGLNEEDEDVLKLANIFDLYTFNEKLKSIYFEMRKDNLNVEELINKTFLSLKKDRENRKKEKIRLIKLIEELIDKFKTEGTTGKTKDKMEELIVKWPKIKEKLLRLTDVDDNDFKEVMNVRDIIKGNVSANLRELINAVRDILDSSEFKSFFIIKKAEEIIKPLTEVIKQIEIKYNKRKEDNSQLDFYDLQDKLIKVLKDEPKLIENINNKYKYIMVDEFQDNNPVQEKIIQILGESNKINIFLVGDPKQSIYRFRGADVRVFNRQKEEILKREGKVLKLSKNFRSRPSILNFVNFLFEQILENDPGITYQRLDSFREEFSADIQLNVIAATKFEEKLNADELRELEAEYLAEKVSDIIDNKNYLIKDGKKKRTVKPQDIAYLFQALSNVKLYENALYKRNISVSVVNGRGFFKQQVVLDMMNLMKVLKNRFMDFELTGLLRSPFCGLDDNDIYWLNTKKGDSLWSYLNSSNLEYLEDKKREDVYNLIKVLNNAHGLKNIKHPYDLICDIIDKTKYKESLKADMNYKQSWANLKKVLEQIKKLYQEKNCSLNEVLEFYQKNKEKETREGQAELKKKEGSVQLMSIHQAKGLEFPVVILPDIQRPLIHHNSYPDILIDNKSGMGLKIKTNSGSYGTPLYNTLIEKEKEEELYEKIRLLYVAMTRAEDKLILSGYHKNNLKSSFRDSNNWLNWLACYLNIEDFNENKRISFGENKDPKEGYLDINIIKDRLFIKDKKETELNKPKNELNIKNWNDIKEWEDISNNIRSLSKNVREYKTELSVTGLLEYEKCPRLYYFHNIKGVPSFDYPKVNGKIKNEVSSDIDPLTKGILVHRLYELSGLEREPSDYFKQALRELNIIDIDYKKSNEILNIVRNYQFREKKNLDGKVIKENYYEKEFTLNYEKFFLKGMIDNIYIYHNGDIEIIDFKTNNLTKNDIDQKSKEYELQLKSYCLAASKLFNKNKIKYRIEYLIPEVNYSDTLFKKDLIAVEENINNLGNTIAESFVKKDYPIIENKDCKYCNYGKLCK